MAGSCSGELLAWGFVFLAGFSHMIPIVNIRMKFVTPSIIFGKIYDHA